jgi:UDP-N-acetylmuramoyl-L-alanyl-D-glutamate--2,6-diaminopimelate ligase
LPGGATAVVDYAHTPDALAAVLSACRELTDGRVIVVFGCGGDRDQGKRPMMGAVAARQADRVWITSDNPRSERPAAICERIEEGYRSQKQPRAERHQVVVDRTQAIREALAVAEAGDIVVVAGKGHEDYQLVAGKKLPLDDRRIIQEWIREAAHA